MSLSGEAVGRARGLVVFIRHGLPGEVVEAAITHQRKTWARGTALDIAHPSPNRVVPVCPHFGTCGGCEWQHAAYDAQVWFKTQIVQQQLARAEVLPCIPCPLPYGYRNHTQVALAADGAVGYREAGSQRVMPIRACPILDPSPEELLHFLIRADIHPPDRLREIHLRAGMATGERMMVFELDSNAVDEAARQVAGLTAPAGTAIVVSATDGKSRPVIGSAWLRERVGDITCTYSATTFFQVNRAMAGRLVEEVLEGLELSGHENVLELYCGAGLFTVPISKHAGYALGIEASRGAARDASNNLRSRANARVIAADVRRGLLDDDVRKRAWQRVVLDPPRAGVDAETLSEVAAVGATRLVYVSCDPATLAHDAGRLKGYGYELRRVQPLDLFPQTHHIETVAVFEQNM